MQLFCFYQLFCLLDVFGGVFHWGVWQVTHGAKEIQVGPCLLLQSSGVLDLKERRRCLSESMRGAHCWGSKLCGWEHLIESSDAVLLCQYFHHRPEIYLWLMGRIPNTLADLSVHHLVRIIIKAVCVVWERGNPRLVSSLPRFSRSICVSFLYQEKKSQSRLLCSFTCCVHHGDKTTVRVSWEASLKWYGWGSFLSKKFITCSFLYQIPRGAYASRFFFPFLDRNTETWVSLQRQIIEKKIHFRYWV